MNYLSQVITVTKWEFTRFFKPKNELLGIVIMILVSVVFYFGTRYVLSDSDEKIELAVCQNLDSNLVERLSADFTLDVISESQKSMVLENISDNQEGVLLDEDEAGFVIHAYKKTRSLGKIKEALNDYYQIRQGKQKGLEPGDLTQILSPAPVTESFFYTGNSRNREVLAYFFAGLMAMAVFLSFAYQFTAITGEKQLKITEQIVSAITPQVWMDGKIFGITLTGLGSMLTYALFGVIGGVLIFQFTGAPISAILGYLHLPSILLYIPFALTGILIWNAILAAIASIITDPNNSGKSSLMMLPMVFVIASFLVTREPDSSFSVFLSWFPLTSATAMPMRWAITEVELWQLTGAFLGLVLTFYLIRKLAAKIFHMSILLSGKEPSWGEVFRQLKGS